MEIFGPFAANAMIDMSKLVLSGHSFGGITAVTTAANLRDDAQPSAVTVYDPWFFPNSEKFVSTELTIKCPIFVASSEYWNQRIPIQYYDHWKLFPNILKNAKLQGRIEHIIVRRIGHEC